MVNRKGIKHLTDTDVKMCNFGNRKVQQMLCSFSKEMYFRDKNMATNNDFQTNVYLMKLYF